MNSCDHLDRRVQKITPEVAHSFFYDGWMLVKEVMANTNGTTEVVEYHWGNDLSGSRGVAAGVGGLLYISVTHSSTPNSSTPNSPTPNSSTHQLYIPWYDSNGNIMGYWDDRGKVVASFTYSAFGETYAYGDNPDAFALRFSTKYHDIESDLYYYTKRFYHPYLHRWLTRDSIEEEGGVNLYSMCGNNILDRFDALGLITYSQLSANYPLKDSYSTDVNAATNIWGTIGGKVLLNARNGTFRNSCSIRLSHALNKSGDLIPFIKGKTASGKNPPKWWYIFRVSDMKSYLEGRYGQPIIYSDRKRFEKCAPQGILVLDVPGWSDASGHATLWDGKTTIDEAKDEYFGKPNVKFNLWRLK